MFLCLMMLVSNGFIIVLYFSHDRTEILGIARLCCDTRRHVRSQALNYLQKALLLHDLQTLSPIEWENCFNKVRNTSKSRRQ